jgi:hypothetical protein
MTASLRSRCVPWLLAVAFYGTLTITLTWPLVVHLGAVLPHDLGDPLLNTWILWWNAHAIPLTERWWNAPMFWPATGSMAFSEQLLGLAPITTPLQWAGASAATAYDVAFLLSFLLSALAAHALAFSLTGRRDAAFVAGLVFGFSPYRIAHLPHLQVLTAYWMPVALLALHRYVRGGGISWLACFGAAWLLQALSNGYYLLFFPVLLAAWILWFVPVRAAGRRLGAIGATFALSSLPLIPILLRYRQVHAMYGMERGYGEIYDFSADVTSLLDASPLMRFWKLPSYFHRPEGELFPGLTAVLLVAIVGIGWVVNAPGRARTPRLCATLLGASILLTSVALSPLLVGPWAIVIGGRTLVSVGVVSKPLSLAICCLLAAVPFEPRIYDTWRRRSTMAFYVLAALLMFVLSLGPQARFLGQPFAYASPYAWLMLLPGYNGLRVPARFAMPGILCLAVASALALARLTDRVSIPSRRVLAAAVICGVLLDGWTERLPLPALPAQVAALPGQPTTPVMELPLGDTEADTAAMYRAMYHHRPLVNGYSGYSPPYYPVLRTAFEANDEKALDELLGLGPLTVVVDERRDLGLRWSEQLARRAGASDLGSTAGHRTFALPATAPSAPAAVGRPLQIRSVAANRSPVRAGAAIDGDVGTRWHSGTPQRGMEEFSVDLGDVHLVDGLRLATGDFPSDFPRILSIDASIDGREWTTCWRGPTASLVLVGAMHEIRTAPLTIAFEASPARFVRLRQLGSDPHAYWSIAELAVYGR